MQNRIIIALMLVLAAANISSAATYYVSETGSDSNPGSSGSPWLTIQHAASTAGSGDTIIIANGTYSEYVTPKSGETFLGASQFGATMGGFEFSGLSGVIVSNLYISAALNSASYTLDFSGTSCQVLGCWLYQGGKEYFIQYNGASNVVAWCVITGGPDTPGPPAQVFELQPTSAYCIIMANVISNINGADCIKFFGTHNLISSNEMCYFSETGGEHVDFVQTFGAGQIVCEYTIVEDNFVHDCYNINSALGQTGVNDGGQPDDANLYDIIYRNNIIANIDSGGFSGAPYSLYYNNLFWNVGWAHGYPLAFYGPPTHTNYLSTGSQLINNAFVGCSGGAPVEDADQNLVCSNNFYCTSAYAAVGSGKWVGYNYIDGGNPQFVNAPTATMVTSASANDASQCDFHLLSTSPLIGAGYPLTGISGDWLIEDNPVDHDGNPRGPSWDIGPYQYSTGAVNTNPPAIVTQPLGATNNTMNGVQLNVYASGGQPLGYQWYFASSPVSGDTGASLVLNQTNQSGNWYAIASNQWGTAQSATATVLITNTVTNLVPLSFSVTNPAVILNGFQETDGYISASAQSSSPGEGPQLNAYFQITNAGNYGMLANVLCSNASSKSWWINIDSMPVDPNDIWDVYPYYTNWWTVMVSWRGTNAGASTGTNDQYNPKIWNLAAGQHELILVGREAGAQLRSITITPYTTVVQPPQNLRVVAVGR